MTTRLVFFAVALMIVGALFWAYHHDVELQKNAMLVNLGDPNESVRELLGDPSSEGSCGKLTVAPSKCTDEYIYKRGYPLHSSNFCAAAEPSPVTMPRYVTGGVAMACSASRWNSKPRVCAVRRLKRKVNSSR